MSRIKKYLQSLNRTALVTYIMAGDPNYQTSLDVLNALPDAGADIIELGMPFTDPMADGPVIQKAGQRALNAGANMHQTLKMLKEFRAKNQSTPVVLMGYINPVHSYGIDKFIEDAKDAGADGLLLVDLPPEESETIQELCNKAEIDFIRLLTPTSNEKRLPYLLNNVSGFLYYVSVAGITGAAKANADHLKPHINQIKSMTDTPLAIGFGIKTPEDAKAMADLGEAVVVGSAIIQTLDEADNGKEVEAVTNFVQSLSNALQS